MHIWAVTWIELWTAYYRKAAFYASSMLAFFFCFFSFCRVEYFSPQRQCCCVHNSVHILWTLSLHRHQQQKMLYFNSENNFYLPVEIILYLNATDIQSISQNSIVYSTKKCTFSVSQALREAGRQGQLQGIYLENLQAGFGRFVKGLFELMDFGQLAGWKLFKALTVFSFLSLLNYKYIQYAWYTTCVLCSVPGYAKGFAYHYNMQQ